jgi:hypothetical protein
MEKEGFLSDALLLNRRSGGGAPAFERSDLV